MWKSLSWKVKEESNAKIASGAGAQLGLRKDVKSWIDENLWSPLRQGPRMIGDREVIHMGKSG